MARGALGLGIAVAALACDPRGCAPVKPVQRPDAPAAKTAEKIVRTEPPPKKRSSQPRLVGTRERLGVPCAPPMRVAVGQLDAVGRPEIVVACEDSLVVLDSAGRPRASIEERGWPQVLLARDLDGDGRAEVLAGWGRSRRRRQAQARLSLFRLSGKKLRREPLLSPSSTRQEIADLAVERTGASWSILVAHFVSKYSVRHVRLARSKSGVKETELGRWRMAMRLASLDLLGGKKLAVGRLYGDAIGLDGDAFVLAGGKRIAIPTTGGVRSLAAADLDGDGREELLLGDGWAQRYAKDGRALLTVGRWDGKAFRARRMARLPGEYTIERIVVGDADRSGSPEILTLGNRTLRLFHKRRDGKWSQQLLGLRVGDAAFGDLDGDGLDEVVAVGRTSWVIRLRGLL